jgi:hypothetical protein
VDFPFDVLMENASEKVVHNDGGKRENWERVSFFRNATAPSWPRL